MQSVIHHSLHVRVSAEVKQWCFGTLCVCEETDCALLVLQGVLGWELSPVGRAGLCLPGYLGPALLGCLLAYMLHRVLSE